MSPSPQPLPEGQTRQALARMTAALGEPHRDLVILGEGNTSMRVDEERFLVKASGHGFQGITGEGFVCMRFAPILALLDSDEDVDEARLMATYGSAKDDPEDSRRPSVETVFHAGLLQLPGVQAVAHTHPTAINALSCCQQWPAAFQGRCFPDEAVVCGPETVLVDYLDPGVALARAVVGAAEAYVQRHGQAPKMLVMRNHGLIVCGADAAECERITAMAVKAARIRAGALASGGLTTLDEATTAHLLARPDEKYRQRQLAGNS
ncbi:MAG: class II aldolase/adducin family protein [Planctomycetota bacterium]|nr:MAG: class II aldolase/adducin family protein [Planctomycetota bacterium]